MKGIGLQNTTMSVIDEVKQRIDIVDIVSQYVRLTKSGRTFRGLCPFHSEKHPSFFVYPEQQSWHCFGACNTGGDAFSFVMKKEGITFGEALRRLADRTGITIPSRFEPETGEKELLYQVNQAATQYFHNLLLNSAAGKKAQSYVSGRGFSSKTITDFQLGFSLNSWDALKEYLLERDYNEKELVTAGLLTETEDGRTYDRFRNRLMFPISDIKGRIIGFGARVLDDSLPKYLNSPQTPAFDKSSNLYGINLAGTAIRQQDLAVIVEGYMDVITAHQNGFTNVVASMGTAVTEKQLSMLKRLTKNLLFALDADAAGEEATLRGVGYENTLNAEVKVIIMPQGKDPDDVIKQDAQTWQHLLQEAVPIVDYTFDKVSSELDLTTASGKSQTVDKLLPIVAEIRDATRQDHYLNKLVELTGTSYHKLETALSRAKSERRTREPKEEAFTHALRPIHSSPVEEYCLALLLQHPELKASNQHPLPEYFENSENREIFIACQQASDASSLKDKLDTTLWEYVDYLITKSLPPNQIGEKYTNCTLRLQERRLRDLERKKETILALEAETGGTAAELAKLEEQGIESSIQLGEVLSQKGIGGQGKGGKQ